jgi:hypothetical protein
MAIHHTTYVLPAAAFGLPHDTPFVVLAADTAEETGAIPWSPRCTGLGMR